MGNTFTVKGPFWVFGREFKFSGGPYRDAPEDAFRVCLLDGLRLKSSYDVWSPIPDFGVPPSVSATREHLTATLRAALDGEDVYVGCMGGKGRTGLFLALLVKVLGGGEMYVFPGARPFTDPVSFVRNHFDHHAVETDEQMHYVDEFDVKPIQTWLFWEIIWRKFLSLFRGRKPL